MILIQKHYPNLPPLHRVRDKHDVDPLEFEILKSAMEDDSLSSHSQFTASLMNSFDVFQDATSNELSVNHTVFT